MKLVRNILLIISGSLLLLHTLVPHHHHSQIDETTYVKSHQQANSLFDYIKLGFHLDLGSNHLEEFNVSCSFITADLSHSSLITPPTLALFQLPDVGNLTIPQLNGLEANPFRGPPLSA